MTEIKLKPDAIAKILTIGARRACLGMSTDWQPSGSTTFNANAAEYLLKYEDYTGVGALCEKTVLQKKGRARNRNFYRLTPLGKFVKQELERM